MAITTPHTRTPTQPRRQPLRPDVGGAAVYDQESVTPTFQVDDLHCIVGARARDGPHLDSGSPFLPSRPSSPAPPPPLQSTSTDRQPPPHARGDAAGGGGGEVERVENGPDRGLSLLETEDCLAGYSELRGGVRGWLYFDCIVAVFLPFFLVFAFP